MHLTPSDINKQEHKRVDKQAIPRLSPDNKTTPAKEASK